MLSRANQKLYENVLPDSMLDYMFGWIYATDTLVQQTWVQPSMCRLRLKCV